LESQERRKARDRERERRDSNDDDLAMKNWMGIFIYICTRVKHIFTECNAFILWRFKMRMKSLLIPLLSRLCPTIVDGYIYFCELIRMFTHRICPQVIVWINEEKKKTATSYQ
jgi:hypothetical protein